MSKKIKILVIVMVLAMSATAFGDDFHSISGTISSSTRDFPEGVLVTATGGFSGSDVTDVNGEYTITGVPEGTEDITITPSMVGYVFNPVSISITDPVTANVEDQDFIGTWTAYTISGTISSSTRDFLEGVSVTATGYTPVLTNENGEYTISNVAHGTVNITLTPTLIGYVFNPVSILIPDPVTANVEEQDFTGTYTEYTISGTIKNVLGELLENVSVTATGFTPVLTTVEGVYTIIEVPHGTANITVTPASDYYTFGPVNILIEVITGNITGKNFTGTRWSTSVPMPVAPITLKAVKDGGAMVAVPNITDEGGVIYAFKGWKSKLFKMFDGEAWTDKESIPFAIRPGYEPPRYYKKYPSKGASLCWDGDNTIYATKGSNTREFWAYDITQNTWTQKASLPYPPVKSLKGGTSICWYNNTIYLLAGGQKKDSANFFYYSTTAEGDTWLQAPMVPCNGDPERPKVYKDGSCLAVWVSGEDAMIYALKGGDSKGNFFYEYKYDEVTEGWNWTAKKTLPLYDSSNFARPKKTKVKDGGAMTSKDNDAIYAIKGGGKQEFWKFTPGEVDIWTPLDTIPRVAGIYYRKSVPKTGAALAYLDDYVYLLKGNKLDEFWKYNLHVPTPLMAQVKPATIASTTADAISKNNFSLTATTFSRTVNYTVSTAGKVSIKLYNATGRLVETIHDGYMNAGSYTTTLSQLNSGVYFLKYSDRTNSADVKIIVQ